MASERVPPRRVTLRRPSLARLAVGVGLVLFVVVLFVVWFVVRVEVEANHILVLVNKTGKAIPAELADEFSDQVVLYPELVKAIAARAGESEERVRTRYKGIRYEWLGEGRYFYNPYSYRREVMPATQISDNEVGVLIRKFGKPLPFPKTVATELDERGPVAEILSPGRHNINLLAYDVQKFPAIKIPEGHRGVVTLLSGADPQRKNTYTVEPGEKGVQRKLRRPGLEYYNPYLERIEIIDLRSHKYDMVGNDAIQFPSNDSFTITIEGTIEWAIMEDRAAEVLVAYGDEDDILNKVILPNARSISRIEGSKLPAREFISGTTRLAFQTHFYEQLRDECHKQGIQILAAVVRDIQPPAEIAALISQREQADQEIERSTNEMEEARSQARLVEQQELQERNRQLGDTRREVVSVVKQAEQRKVVAVTDANRAFEVARLHLEAATKEAAAMLSRGSAEAHVVLLEFTAKAEPLKQAVSAFGDGETYAQLFFLEKIAPSIRSILSNTEGPFADIFRQFQDFRPVQKEGGDQ
ncbi:MAG: hypothetical protein JXB13_12560 [Phycisphaerae bacterium]|nr:hypothetical protein [Phycisphaerae bacterium]